HHRKTHDRYRFPETRRDRGPLLAPRRHHRHRGTARPRLPQMRRDDPDLSGRLRLLPQLRLFEMQLNACRITNFVLSLFSCILTPPETMKSITAAGFGAGLPAVITSIPSTGP